MTQFSHPSSLSHFPCVFLLHSSFDPPSNPTEPDWASLTLGVFVCQACSLLHRSIPHISRVKSVQDTWDASDVEVGKE